MWRRSRAVGSTWQVQKLNDVVMNAVKTIAVAPINLHACSIMAAHNSGEAGAQLVRLLTVTQTFQQLGRRVAVCRPAERLLGRTDRIAGVGADDAVGIARVVVVAAQQGL